MIDGDTVKIKVECAWTDEVGQVTKDVSHKIKIVTFPCGSSASFLDTELEASQLNLEGE